jgi:hypothetical protein
LRGIRRSPCLTDPNHSKHPTETNPMPFDDPTTWAQAAAAAKTAFDSVRSAISIVKDIRSLGGGNEHQQKVVDNALTVASTNTAIAEAELAKAFGYELCKCDFPPTPMKTVGYLGRPVPGKQVGDPVYECPKCGYNTAGPFMFTRLQQATSPSSNGSSAAPPAESKGAADICKFCGEPAARMTYSSPHVNADGIKSERWTCSACGKIEPRHVRVK